MLGRRAQYKDLLIKNEWVPSLFSFFGSLLVSYVQGWAANVFFLNSLSFNSLFSLVTGMIKVNADMVHLIDSEKGETMKKSKFVAVAVLSVLAVGAGTLASCGGETEDNIINIQFVPSNDPTKLATLAKHMEPMLHEIEPNYEFKITTGTTYAATTTAMLADQVDIGFLTASGYAEVTLKNPGKVEVLMTAVRDGYRVQEDYKTEEEQRAAMNGEVAGY